MDETAEPFHCLVAKEVGYQAIRCEGSEVVGDSAGASSTQFKQDQAIVIHYPELDSFVVADPQIREDIKAEVDRNGISLQEHGRQCVLLTGSLVSHSESTRGVHYPHLNTMLAGRHPDYAYIYGEALRQTVRGL